jgi:hypothetical protein
MTGLEQIIWYTIPGFILMVPLVLYYPSFLHEEGASLWFGLLALTGGYCFHQIYRAIWEGCCDGFWTRERRSLDRLIEKFNSSAKNGKLNSSKTCDRKKAFLAWEHVFYHELRKEFVDRDRGAWHYILSFRTVSCACWVSALLILLKVFVALICKAEIGSSFALLGISCVVLTATGAFLYWKARLTLRSIVEQEEVVIVEKWPKFYSTLLNVVAGRHVTQP